MPATTILIVDDDRTIVRLCQRLLERASFRVIVASDPLDALHILEFDKIDLLLSDIRMPVMDGFELIARAKELQRGLPVLIMTGFGSVDTAVQALHRGVDGLILKPFENSSDLVQAVQRILDESRHKRDAARLQVLRPLFGVSEVLLAETSLQSVEKLSLEAIVDLFQVCSAAIFRLNMAGGTSELVHLAELGAESVENFELQRQLILLADSSVPAIMINASGPGDQAMQALLRQLGFECALVSFVRRNDHQFVYFAARAQSALPFSEADLEMFAILARQSTAAMENASLYTELKNYVVQVEDSQKALIQAEKMAAVGRLMASLAHEINNPLQAVRNCLHLAAREDVSPQQRQNYLEMTNVEVDRLVNTVRRMLDFSRNGNTEKECLDIEAIITRILGLIEPQLSLHKIQIDTSYHGESQRIYGIFDQIQQVFFNVLLNSMDSMENQLVDRHIWLDVIFGDHEVRVLFEDSGPGLPAEIQPHLFEPFTSTKKNGTGLGLAVSHGIIEKHNGRIAVASPTHMHGACIELVFPVAEEGEEENV